MSKASAHWNVHLDQVDFGIGREYFVGRDLTIRPHGGLRTDWIDQDYKVTYTFFSESSPQKFKMNNRFFGLGFFGGADTNWLLGHGFSMYGIADIALLLGFFDVDQKATQVGQIKKNLDSSFRCGRAILDLKMGLKWSRLFGHNSWGLTFRAGYEYHLYFDQNQLMYLTSITREFKYNRGQGDLTYQGVALSGQIDF